MNKFLSWWLDYTVGLLSSERGAVLSKGKTFGATESVTNTKLHALVDSGSISAIVNADIDAGANIAASKVITVTGGAVIAAGLLELSVEAGASIEQESTCLEIRPRIGANVAGSTSGIRINVNCSTANYLDYGLDIRSMSSNQTAAMRILATPDTAALATGILLEGQDTSTSVITNAFEINGGNTNLFKFGDEDGSQAITTDTNTPGTAATHKIKCVAGSTTFYLAGYGDF